MDTLYIKLVGIKRISLIILIFLGSISAYSQNITDTSKKEKRLLGVMKIYPLQLLSGEIRFSVEKNLSDKISMEVGAGYLYRGYSGDVDGGLPITPSGFQDYFSPLPYLSGYNITLNLKGYISGNNRTAGTYLSPGFFFKYYSSHIIYDKYYMMGGGLLIGHKFSSKNKFSIEIYTGLGLKNVREDFGNPDIPGPLQITSNSYLIVPTGHIGITLDYSIIKNKK